MSSIATAHTISKGIMSHAHHLRFHPSRQSAHTVTAAPDISAPVPVNGAKPSHINCAYSGRGCIIMWSS